MEPIEAWGGPIVGDLVIFVYTHGHMGSSLGLIRRDMVEYLKILI